MQKPLSWKVFAFELALYAILVAAYAFVVLHEFGAWFKQLYDHDRQLFAVMALVVMIGQAVGLEFVNGVLMWLLRRGEK